jgi:hypothetical protein
VNTTNQILAAMRLGNAHAAEPQWVKLKAGLYASPDGQWRAMRTSNAKELAWNLLLKGEPTAHELKMANWAGRPIVSGKHEGFYVTTYADTLADCWKEIPKVIARQRDQLDYEIAKLETKHAHAVALRDGLEASGGETVARVKLDLLHRFFSMLQTEPFGSVMTTLGEEAKLLESQLDFLDEGKVTIGGGGSWTSGVSIDQLEERLAKLRAEKGDS